jgi:putative SOS response-associated peptidase YedK
MCGRFNSKKELKELAKLYHADVVPGLRFSPSYNVAPTEQAPIVVEKKDHEREITLGRFGMTMRAGGKTFPLLNIQSEKATNREDFKTRRCIVPADGFYEWEKVSPKDRQPYYYSPREGIFSFAGVWKQEKAGLAFTILTTGANELLQPIHHRMPVILSHNAIGAWLDPETPADTLASLMQPFPAPLMQAWKVRKIVNSPRNKDASCINSL